MDVSVASMVLWLFMEVFRFNESTNEAARNGQESHSSIERHSSLWNRLSLSRFASANRLRALRSLRLSRKATLERLSDWHNNDKKYPNAWLTATALSVSGRVRSGAPFAFMRRQMDLTIDARLSPKSEEKSKSGVSESLAHSL
jgi:hypothetical protein